MTQPPEEATQYKGDPVPVPRGGCCFYILAAQSCINSPHHIVWSCPVIWSDGRGISSSPESWLQVSSVAEVLLRNLQAKTVLYFLSLLKGKFTATRKGGQPT